MLEITQDDKKLKQKKHTSFTEVFRMIYIIIYNIFYFAFLGIKLVFFDFWANLFMGASYQVDKTYRHVTNATNSKEAFLTEEETHIAKHENEKTVLFYHLHNRQKPTLGEESLHSGENREWIQN